MYIAYKHNMFYHHHLSIVAVFFVITHRVNLIYNICIDIDIICIFIDMRAPPKCPKKSTQSVRKKPLRAARFDHDCVSAVLLVFNYFCVNFKCK